MTTVKVTPGPDAHRAFRLGMVAAGVVGLIVPGALFWVHSLSLTFLAVSLVVLYPVYLVVAASALSVWLGFDKDATDLRPVSREAERNGDHFRSD